MFLWRQEVVHVGIGLVGCGQWMHCAGNLYLSLTRLCHNQIFYDVAINSTAVARSRGCRKVLSRSNIVTSTGQMVFSAV